MLFLRPWGSPEKIQSTLDSEVGRASVLGEEPSQIDMHHTQSQTTNHRIPFIN